MSEKSVGNRVSSSTRWTHGSNKLHVDQLSEGTRWLSVIPSRVVHPLADDLNRRLCKVLLSQRHVQVINEEDVLLSGRWSEDSLPPLFHPCINLVLSLVRTGSCRESHENGDVLLGHAGH